MLQMVLHESRYRISEHGFTVVYVGDLGIYGKGKSAFVRQIHICLILYTSCIYMHVYIYLFQEYMYACIFVWNIYLYISMYYIYS